MSHTQKTSRWFIPFCFIVSLLGVVLTTGHSPAASLRYDTDDNVDYGEQFQRVLDAIYNTNVNVDEIPSEAKLFNTAVDAILKEVGDEHGRYYSAAEYHLLNKDIRPQNYVGVGMEITNAQGGAMIISIFDNSSLNNTSIRLGDMITAAGSVGEPPVKWDAEAQNLVELADAIIGPAGSKVVLNIKRGVLNFKPITVTRIETRRQYVFMDLSPSGILTVRMTQFSGTVYKDITAMLYARGWMTSIGTLNTLIVKGVVLDLRDNPGGVLGQAIHVSDLFLPRNTPSIRVSSRPDYEGGPSVHLDYTASRPRMFPSDIPRVVLINGGSASASEIVAGAVKLHKEGFIMGEKSYGKGSVQSITPLPGGTAIKTTTAIYLAGGSMEIDGIGVSPNLKVVQPDVIGESDDARRFNNHLIQRSMDPEIDHQLNVAHTYINSFLSGKYTFSMDGSRRAAESFAHAIKTDIWSVCKAKGLMGCP